MIHGRLYLFAPFVVANQNGIGETTALTAARRWTGRSRTCDVEGQNDEMR